MSIFNTYDKYLSNVGWKSDMRKVPISSVNSSSTLFSFSIHEMYNRVNSAQNKCLVLNSYLPSIIKSIFPNKHYDDIFSENSK